MKRRRYQAPARRPLTTDEERAVRLSIRLLTQEASARGRRRAARRFRLAAQTLLELRCEGAPEATS